mmetsp:Transcript_10227/g.28752  ORF Transcript_10227/g.28752 Transcript_10227/m.28752 type:complete len:215 (+) Transcript_10227:371-1015(+)
MRCMTVGFRKVTTGPSITRSRSRSGSRGPRPLQRSRPRAATARRPTRGDGAAPAGRTAARPPTTGGPAPAAPAAVVDGGRRRPRAGGAQDCGEVTVQHRTPPPRRARARRSSSPSKRRPRHRRAASLATSRTPRVVSRWRLPSSSSRVRRRRDPSSYRGHGPSVRGTPRSPPCRASRPPNYRGAVRARPRARGVPRRVPTRRRSRRRLARGSPT